MYKWRHIDTMMFRSCLIMRNNRVFPDQEEEEIEKAFWLKIYPAYEKIFDSMFPEVKEARESKNWEKISELLPESHLTSAMALIEYVRRNGFFHVFRDRLCFIEPPGGNIMITGARITSISLRQLSRFLPIIMIEESDIIYDLIEEYTKKISQSKKHINISVFLILLLIFYFIISFHSFWHNLRIF